MAAIVGLAFVIASAGLFWRVLPVNGKPHRLARMPVVESIMPIGVVAGFAVGVALMFASVSTR